MTFFFFLFFFLKLYELYDVKVKIFVPSCPVFQNRDGQHIFIFRMEQDEMYIYRMELKSKHALAVCLSEHYIWPKNSD
jgi:hypothetical protein